VVLKKEVSISPCPSQDSNPLTTEKVAAAQRVTYAAWAIALRHPESRTAKHVVPIHIYARLPLVMAVANPDLIAGTIVATQLPASPS